MVPKTSYKTFMEISERIAQEPWGLLSSLIYSLRISQFWVRDGKLRTVFEEKFFCPTLTLQ